MEVSDILSKGCRGNKNIHFTFRDLKKINSINNHNRCSTEHNIREKIRRLQARKTIYWLSVFVFTKLHYLCSSVNTYITWLTRITICLLNSAGDFIRTFLNYLGLLIHVIHISNQNVRVSSLNLPLMKWVAFLWVSTIEHCQVFFKIPLLTFTCK